VVGGGLTSAVATHLLSQQGQHEVAVWDKARGAGGRMSTSRGPMGEQATVDLGAQYVSATEDYWKSHA